MRSLASDGEILPFLRVCIQLLLSLEKRGVILGRPDVLAVVYTTRMNEGQLSRYDQLTQHDDNDEKPDLVVLGAQCHLTRSDSKLGLGGNRNEGSK